MRELTFKPVRKLDFAASSSSPLTLSDREGWIERLFFTMMTGAYHADHHWMMMMQKDVNQRSGKQSDLIRTA